MPDKSREAVLHEVENLVIEAVAKLLPIAGEQLTVGIIMQMAEEHARLASSYELLAAETPSTARH